MNTSINRKIKLLPDFLSNQIAAGEVVQRPESAVKELLENAIDAGAKTITLIVKDSGKSLIHIIDDGMGMDAEDLKLSIKRHATSKISTQEDLEAISSFGFRGEALASISSVARLEIISNTSSDQSKGLRLNSEPNKEPTIEPIITPQGTQIIVRNLFYNVPARRKFLRSNITEFRHISDTAIKTALSHPDRRVVFYDDDTLVFDSPAGTLDKTIKDVLGVGFYSSLIQMKEREQEGITISGYISELNSFRSTRTNQYLFLNQRPIKSKSLAHSIMSAYDPYLAKGQYPAYILNISIDPRKVDINIHPQKHEVKFENEKKIYDMLLHAISETIDTGGFTPIMGQTGELGVPAKLPHSTMDVGGKRVLVNTDTGEIIPTRNDWTQQGEYKRFGSENRDHKPKSPDFKRWDSISSDRQRLPASGTSLADLLYSDDNDISPTISKESINIGDNYTVIKNRNALLVLSLPNIWDSYLHKKIKEAKLSKAQDLMFPIEFQLPNSELADSEIHSALKELGCHSEINDSICTIFSVPQEISSLDISELFNNLISINNKDVNSSILNRRQLAEAIIKQMPRKISFQADEREELIRYSLSNPDINLSPRGKRLYKRLELESIADWF